MPERRKTKGDKRAKARYHRYKKGGGKIVRSKERKERE